MAILEASSRPPPPVVAAAPPVDLFAPHDDDRAHTAATIAELVQRLIALEQTPKPTGNNEVIQRVVGQVTVANQQMQIEMDAMRCVCTFAFERPCLCRRVYFSVSTDFYFGAIRTHHSGAFAKL
jgi:hypothetical protein